jgi:16S rRNA (cytosine1402-N4)-methyltransferase
MLDEVMSHLNPRPGDVIVDGTLGLGGHAKEFCNRIRPNGKLFGFDWDTSMFVIASKNLASIQKVEVVLTNQDFRSAASVLRKSNVKANGVLLDLGLNSAQVDDPERGMSFREVGPLDMRMDRRVGEPASAWLNRASLDEIDDVLRIYGDERWSRAIARSAVSRRKEQPFRTTEDLVDCVLAAIPVGARDKRIHPATRTFQAVRIFISGELDGLDVAIQDLASELAPNGAIAVLSYHSGEDRIVKNAFRDLSRAGYTDVLRKPLLPTAAEVARNSRSRSAKMRVLRAEGSGVQATGSRREGNQG